MDTNPLQGINRVCAQCVRDCKQFENVALINCPKFHSIRSDDPVSSSFTRRTRMQNKGGKGGK